MVDTTAGLWLMFAHLFHPLNDSIEVERVAIRLASQVGLCKVDEHDSSDIAFGHRWCHVRELR